MIREEALRRVGRYRIRVREARKRGPPGVRHSGGGSHDLDGGSDPLASFTGQNPIFIGLNTNPKEGGGGWWVRV